MQNPDTLVKFAVHEIVTNINSGLTPQAATEKVAEELQLNPNFIKRASEAVNVALHHNHFKKNPDHKADDFETVDAQKAVEKLYSGKEKTASEFRSELFSSFQSPETTAKFSRYLEDGPHREVYTELANETDSKNTTSERGIYEKSANYVRDLKKTAENKQAEAIESQYQVNNSFCSILKKFAQDELNRTSWHEFESQVFSKHGEDSVQYLDLLYKTSGLKEPRGKHDSKYTMFTQCKEAEQFDRFLNNATAMKLAKTTAEEASELLQFEENYIKEAFAKRGCELLNQTKQAEDGTILERLEKSMKSEREKVASIDEEDPVLAIIKTQKTAALDKKAEQVKAAIDYIDTAVNAFGSSKPSLSASSNSPEDNRERAFMLQELATTDPILSKMPTKHVVNAYQQMLRIAPELSKEKELTRAFLRQAGASQAIDPFQGQQLIEANTKLLKQHQLQQGIPSSPGSDK